MGAKQGREVVVDVREQLRAGKEPFSDIMAAAETCAVGDTLVLYATFKPVPLLAVLKSQGFEGEATPLENREWRVDFRRVSGSARADAGGPPGIAGSPGMPGPQPRPANASAAFDTDGTSADVDEAAEQPADIHLDNRGLEPPEPMVRTLEAIYALKKGQRIVGKFDRTPMFLLPKLDDMGYVYEVDPGEDGRATVTIQHGPKHES